MCCGGSPVSRLGVTAGLLSLISVISAVLTGSWLYTREPLSLPGSRNKSSITFKIGLWRVCSTLKRVLTTPNTLLPTPGCQLIPYSGWREVRETDLGITWSSLEFTPTFITKMRYATPLVAVAAVMVVLATLLAVLGHCHGDVRSLVACGLYTLGGLVLASGLVVFVSVLSDVASNRSQFEHRYGSSFHAAAAACVLSQTAALLSISAYLRRFSTVEDMVRAIVPGADRKLGKHQLSTPPDLCATKPLSSNRSCRTPANAVIPSPHRYSTIIHQGLLGVAEGSTSSESSPPCSAHSLPRRFPPRSPHSHSINTLPRSSKFANRPLDPFLMNSFSLPRKTLAQPLNSPSSESQNT